MIDAKALSRAIRAKKKNLLRADMDYAGQDALDPNAADDIEQNLRVGAAMEDAGVEGMDHEPASPMEMGEEDSTQNVEDLKKISERIAKYFKSL